MRVMAWAAFPAVFIGLVLIPMIGVWAPVVAVLIFVLVAGFALGITEGAGSVASTWLHPAAGGRGVTNSRAEALLAQGRWQDAVDEWEMTAQENPDDPTASSAVARIHRDHLSNPDQAVIWFKKAFAAAGSDPGARVLLRELVEVARRLPDQGATAAPVLARYADANQENSEGTWASEELARIKEVIRDRERPSED